jgi:hypothetical protein
VGYYSISSNIQDSDQSVQEPVNGNHKLKAIGNTTATKHSVVGSNDKNQSRCRDGSCTSRTNSGEDDQQNVGSNIGFNAIQNGKPNAGTREVNCRSIHVDGSSKRKDKSTDVIRNYSSRLDTFQGHWKGGSTGSTSQSSSLGRNNMLEVGERVLAGQKVVEENISEEKMGSVSHQVGSNQVSHIGEGTSKILLGTNGIGNQRKNSKGGDSAARVSGEEGQKSSCLDDIIYIGCISVNLRNDPVNHSEQNITNSLKEVDHKLGGRSNTVLSLLVVFFILLKEDSTQGNTKDNGKDDDGCKISFHERQKNVVCYELHEDTRVDGVTHGDIFKACSIGASKGASQVHDFKLRIWGCLISIGGAHDAAVSRIFHEQASLLGTSQGNIGRTLGIEFSFDEETLEGQDGKKTDNRSDHSGGKVENNGLK